MIKICTSCYPQSLCLLELKGLFFAIFCHILTNLSECNPEVYGTQPSNRVELSVVSLNMVSCPVSECTIRDEFMFCCVCVCIE